MEKSHNTEDLPLNQPILNPMVFHQGFQHITEQIFEKIDKNSLKNCREIVKSWQNCIDNQHILWKKIAKENGGTKSFQIACKIGHIKMAKMLIQKATEFKIYVNAKTQCAEMILNKIEKLSTRLTQD